MATAEAGGWVIDPKNPNRATYTDEDGVEYEAFKDPEPVDTGVPLEGGPAAPVAPKQNRFAERAEAMGGFGVADETKRAFGWTDRAPQSALEAAVRPLNNAVGNVVDLGARALQGAQVATEVAAEGLDDAVNSTGINELLKDYLPGPIAPGTALMALMEAEGGRAASPFVSGTVSGEANFGKLPERRATLVDNPLEAERAAYATEAQLQAEAKALFENRQSTRADFDALAEKHGRSAWGRELDDALANRDRDTQFVSSMVENAAEYEAAAQAATVARGDALFKARVANPDMPKSVDEGVAHVTDLTADWNNPPRIEIADDFANLADEGLRDSLDPDAIGVTTPDGRVLISMKNVAAEATARNVSQNDILSAVTFHEALGHYGLAQKFGDELDDILLNMYHNNDGNFKKAVDEWEARNPDAYADDVNPLARSAEEVLAEMSEAGRIDPSVMDAFRGWMKQTGRNFGLNLKYSDNEIRTILGMSHNAVVNGTLRDVAANGFRYARAYHGTGNEFERYDNDKTGAFGFSERGATYFDTDPANAGTYAENALPTEFGNIPDTSKQFARLKAIDDEYPNYESMPANIRREVDDLERQVDEAINGREPTPNIRPVDIDVPESELLVVDGRGGRVLKDVREAALRKARAEGKRGVLFKNAIDTSVNKPGQRASDVYALFDPNADSKPGFGMKYMRREAANEDSRVRLSDRPSQPYGSDDVEWANYYRRLAEYKNGRAIDADLRGDTSKAEQYRFEAKKDLHAADHRDPNVEVTIAARIQNHRDTADFWQKRMDKYAARGSVKDVERARLFRDDSRRIAKELAELSLRNKYMRRSVGKGSEGSTPIGNTRREARDTETPYMGMGQIRSRENIEGILGENAPELTKERWNDWIDEANGIRNAVKSAKTLKAGATPAEVLKARESIVKSANRIAQLSRKAADGMATEREMYLLQAEMARNVDMQDALAGVRSNAARVVNSFRIGVETDEAFADAVRNMMRQSGNTVFTNPANFQKLTQQIANLSQNPAGVNQMLKAALKPKAEDYIFRMWYNMMLSSPATHVANIAGTLGNFGADLLENTGAAVMGQGKRFSNADRVRGREIMYRVYGAVRALKQAKTWRETAKSFDTATTGNMTNTKTGGSNVYQGTNKVAKGASYVFEGPTRALAAEDEWWRNILSLSNMHGLAVRNAGNKGLKGSAFWAEVDNLITNPTPEMIAATNDYAKVLQFLDKPSRVAQAINKLTESSERTSGAGRAASVGLKFVIPFVNTPDALIRTTLRRTPLGAFERENVNGWKAGGAERDKVVARMVMGSLLSAWVATKAVEGAITGEGPADPRKRMEWEAAHQPNSIKVGDKWYSIAGLEPVSTNLTAVATLVERYKADDKEKPMFDKVVKSAAGLGRVLIENSYTENLVNLMDAITGGAKGDASVAGLIGGIAGNLTTPAVARKANQMEDPAIRDTTGDGSILDRVEGRVQSGWFNESKKLPQRYDIFGQPLSREFAGPDLGSRVQVREESKDETIREMQRLIDAYPGKVVVGSPGKNVKVNGETKRLNAEEFQDYQHLSGYWITESVRAEMASPTWAAMSDEDKVATIKDIAEDMRKTARETLFQEDEE